MPELPLSNLSVYQVRPTIRIGTQSYAQVDELIIGMELTEQEGGLSALELRFTNVASDLQGEADLAFDDNSILHLGAEITLYAGDQESPKEIFQGIITGIEAEFPEKDAPELLVLAEDRLQQARMARRTEIYTDISLADLGQTIANRLGLQPVITGLSEKVGTWVQLNESDLAFLRRLVIRYDSDVQIVGKELHLSPRADVRRGTQTLDLHSQLRKARVIADLANQVTEVTVTGWDALQGQRVSGNSRGSHLNPGTGNTGAQIMQSAIGDRPHHIGHLAVTTLTEAQAIAEAAFDDRARRFVCLIGTAEGNPALRVGTEVTVTGLGNRFDNTYYIVKACHRYDLLQGYETDFKAECAYWRGQ